MFGSLVIAAAVIAGGEALSGPSTAEADAARGRVVGLVEQAWNSPRFRSALDELDADLASARLDAHPGAPYTEFQREGIGAGLGEADNAAWYVRLGAPLNAPWQRSTIRQALDATDRQLDARRRALAFETAREAVGVWLDLASVEARLEVAKSQLDRLSEALRLQEKRLELGEVSGAEVTQLDLERLRMFSETSGLRAERDNRARELERWAGGAAPAPHPGDLRALDASLSDAGPATGSALEQMVESSPGVIDARLRLARVRHEGRRDRRTVWGPLEAELSWEKIPTIGGVDGVDAVGARVRVPLPIGSLGKRRLVIEMNVVGRDIGSFVDEARRAIADQVALPTGYHTDWGGQFEQQQRAMKRLQFMVPLTLVLIFILLFLNFGRLRPVLLILVNIPLALVGGVAGLLLSGLYLSVSASVGFIALFGIAILNGLVMVEFFYKLEARGRSRRDAILEGAELRLRPVIMTAATTAFGLLPMVWATGVGSEVQRPLAVVVVSGVVTSTLLTLIVLPVLYRWFGGTVGGDTVRVDNRPVAATETS